MTQTASTFYVAGMKKQVRSAEIGARKYWIMFFITLAVAVTARLIFLFFSDAMSTADTQSYTFFFAQLQGEAGGYSGVRTPVYPAIFYLTGNSFFWVRVVQMLMGVGASLLLYQLAFQQTKSTVIGLLVALGFSLYVRTLCFEQYVMTESVSTSLLVFVIWCYSYIHARSRGWQVVGAGFLIGITGLTRPILLLIVPLLPAITVYRNLSWKNFKHFAFWRVPTLLFVSSIIPILLWCGYNAYRIDYFGPSTLTGYNLTQHSGAFIEDAPEEYASIRDIYLTHRTKLVEETGTHIHTIWRAWPEMIATTEKTFPELSRELTRLSVLLIMRNPLTYLDGVAHAWRRFWREDLYCDGTVVHMFLAKCITVAWRIQQPLMISINVLFIICSIGAFVAVLFRPRLFYNPAIVASAIVFLSSIFQAMVEYGENSRYAAPFQPLIILAVALIATHGVNRVKKRWL